MAGRQSASFPPNSPRGKPPPQEWGAPLLGLVGEEKERTRPELKPLWHFVFNLHVKF